jgi:site-specific DNA-methyltransferase (adenine-specific)
MGRFPANILHDGSREVTDFFPSGSSKFFYSAKADKQEKIDREDSHPTVKPVDLMSWLCRLITPPGGKILDPFGGTGSTGIGGALEGFNVTLIERDKNYYKDILTRISRTTGDDLPMFSGKPESSMLL